MVKDDVYYTFIRSAETQDKIPVDVDLLLTIRIVNPYKSLFRVQNWLEATQNQFMPVLRSYIANKPFEELLKRDEGVERDFEALINTLVKPEDEDSRKFKDYLEWHYGVRIKKVGMVRIDPAGERGKVYQEAASKLWEAQKEGERITTLAQAEKKRVETVYETVKNFGDAGLFIKAMETAKAAGEGPSNTIIFPFGSAKDLLRGWIGGKEEKS
jgi:regulator of protease activity HflC (stomatin/prohibitin superfamily)